jgi:hypothetical protein
MNANDYTGPIAICRGTFRRPSVPVGGLSVRIPVTQPTSSASGIVRQQNAASRRIPTVLCKAHLATPGAYPYSEPLGSPQPAARRI